MTSAFSSQPCAAHISQPAFQVHVWEPLIVVELVSGTPPDLRASCEQSFDPHKTGVVLGGENTIGEPLAQGSGQHATEPAGVVSLPFIVSEDLLVDVAFEMNRRARQLGHLETQISNLSALIREGYFKRDAAKALLDGPIGETLTLLQNLDSMASTEVLFPTAPAPTQEK